ncbi:MAG: PAS domain-containing sensor histidine kinase, partial [Alphaproteobacteria bacterium]|nr:PAS domain-containing sensor histidine kinase [Alphaproteobacteria bacterium]
MRGRVVEAMPVLAMALIVLLLGALVWLFERGEQQSQRRQLIEDVLWVEQNLHFHLSSNEEKLLQLAEAAGRDGAAAFLSQARHVLVNNPEID